MANAMDASGSVDDAKIHACEGENLGLFVFSASVLLP